MSWRASDAGRQRARDADERSFLEAIAWRGKIMAGFLDLFAARAKPDGPKPSTMFEADLCTVTLPDEVGEDLSKVVQEAFQEARSKGIRTVFFDMVQRGGEVDHMECVLSEFEAWRSVPGNVVGVMCRGVCASAGIFIAGLASPGYRFADPHCKFMIHSAYTSQSIGRINTQADSEQQWLQYTTRETFARLEKQIGRRMGFFQELLEDASSGQDLNIDSKRAMQLGIIDHVGYPRFETEVRTTVSTKIYLNGERYKSPAVSPLQIKNDDECADVIVDFVKEDVKEEYKPERPRRRKHRRSRRPRKRKAADSDDSEDEEDGDDFEEDGDDSDAGEEGVAASGGGGGHEEEDEVSEDDEPKRAKKRKSKKNLKARADEGPAKKKRRKAKPTDGPDGGAAAASAPAPPAPEPDAAEEEEDETSTGKWDTLSHDSEPSAAGDSDVNVHVTSMEAGSASHKKTKASKRHKKAA